MSYLAFYFDQLSYSTICRIDEVSYSTNCRVDIMIFDEMSWKLLQHPKSAKQEMIKQSSFNL